MGALLHNKREAKRQVHVVKANAKRARLWGKNQLEALRASNQVLEDRIDWIRRENVSLNRERNKLAKAGDHLRKEKQCLLDCNEAIHQICADLVKRNQCLEAENDQLEAKNDQLEMRNSQLQENNAQLQEKLIDMVADLQRSNLSKLFENA